VLPAAVKKGIGTALLVHALQTLKDRRAKLLFLEVSTLNKAALTLYKRQGFERIGDRKDYYAQGEDAVVMAHSFPSS
ncbi:MAG: GNAT family N-acetyltransferase, partial [Pseudomonadota bacterium]